MKKIIIAMMAAVSLLNFSGCDSLDMEPVSSISDANYWKSPDQFKAFNIGLHGLLRSQSSYNIFVSVGVYASSCAESIISSLLSIPHPTQRYATAASSQR